MIELTVLGKRLITTKTFPFARITITGPSIKWNSPDQDFFFNDETNVWGIQIPMEIGLYKSDGYWCFVLECGIGIRLSYQWEY